MAKKNNIRSIRFSDDMITLIEQQAGESFTAKFEALVTRCVWELPAQEAELAKIKKRIEEKREQLRQLSVTANKYQHALDNMKWSMQSLERDISRAASECKTD